MGKQNKLVEQHFRKGSLWAWRCGRKSDLDFAIIILTMYYTDSALVSASFVGTMMLICRILTDLATL